MIYKSFTRQATVVVGLQDMASLSATFQHDEIALKLTPTHVAALIAELVLTHEPTPLASVAQAKRPLAQLM
jgi:hypothetical protein